MRSGRIDWYGKLKGEIGAGKAKVRMNLEMFWAKPCVAIDSGLS